jgi:ATP-binding cassette, subfamily F, member 3
MLRLTSLSLRRGPRVLFADATLTIHRGEKVGVTGANGCGKSSLFALIRNELHADAGDLRLPPNLVIAHVAQETPGTAQSALDYALDGDEELRDIEQQLAEAEQHNDGSRLGELHGHMEHIEGYAAPARAARLLHGLGFADDKIHLPVNEFSGGWRMRLNLARALMCRSDLLLLDEPTNHLDLDAVIWLQQWLQRYPGTLLLISHDRDFLDEVADHILHVEQQQLTLYTGNYTAFERMRAEKLALQQSAFESQQREIKHMEDFVRRFRAKASKARQAQSRVKALERMEQIAPAHVDSPFHFSFLPPKKLPSPLLTIDHAAAGYAGTPILSDLSFSLQAGARIGLLGHNGAGKSTLIKLIAGELEPLAGEVIRARELQLGYFAQHQLEQLSPEASPLLHLQRLDPKASEQSLRNYIGGFGFSSEMALSPVAPFSGGEKARLVLALLIYQRPNLLLLDEPTNHLDLEMRHAMTMALQEYEGALLVVSHDRHLLRSVCDEMLLVDAGKVTEFDGDLDDYRQWLNRADEGDSAKPAQEKSDNSASARKERKRREAEARQRLTPLRKELTKMEKELATLTQQSEVLEQRLAEPDLYEVENSEILKDLLQEKAKLAQKTAAGEERWLSLTEELEQLQSKA